MFALCSELIDSAGCRTAFVAYCNVRERDRNTFISNSMSWIHRHDKIHSIQLIQNRSNIVQLILLCLLPIAQAPWN